MQRLWKESHDRLMKMSGNDDRRGGVCVQQRPEQKGFVLIGSEGDIAGMESLIQAAEKNAAEEDAKQSAAQATIDEYKQQLAIKTRQLDLEERMMVERKNSLTAKILEMDKALKVRLATDDLTSEERSKLTAEMQAQVGDFEKALVEEDARSKEKIAELRASALEIQVRIEEAARPTASPQE